MKVPILTYHSWQATGRDYASDNHIALASDLQTIAQLGMEIVPLEHIVDALLTNRLHELENRVGLSFDDGFHLDVEDQLYPNGETCRSFLTILKETGKSRFVHATSFVIGSGEIKPRPGLPEPSYPDRAVTDLWLKAEKSGLIKIENHGWRHHQRPQSEAAFASQQIQRATNVIDSVIGMGYCRMYAYPFGRVNSFLAYEYLPHNYELHRMKAAFTTNPKPVTEAENRWLIPRYVCGRDWRSPEELRRLLGEGVSRPLPRTRRTSNITHADPGTTTGKSGNSTYRESWDERARTEEGAIAGSDGSSSEASLRLTGQFAARQMAAALNLNRSDSVLELGCGAGRIGRELAPLCARWIGADISSNMLDFAKRRMKHLDSVEFVQLERTTLLGIANNSLDKAYALAVFCHLDKEDMFLYLQEFARTLKTGGCVYFETWNLAHPVGWKRWAFEVRHWMNSAQASRKQVGRNQFSVREEIELLTRQAGLEVCACYSDSPWIQVVAFKPGEKVSIEACSRYLGQHAAQIAYSQEFTECFSKKLDLISGIISPGDMLDWLEKRESSEVVSFFRRHLLEEWKTNVANWGEPPG